jgi:3-dehydroquinate synthase class II
MPSWIEALKEYSKKTGVFAVPRKGSAEYDAVLKIMARDKETPAPVPAPVKKQVVVEKPKRVVQTKKEVLENLKEETAKVKAKAKVLEETARQQVPPPPKVVAKEADKPVITRDQLIATLTEKQKEKLIQKAQKKAEKKALRAEKLAQKNMRVSIVQQPVELQFI